MHLVNVSDPRTLIARMRCLQQQFSLSGVILVGDRGMIAKANMDAMWEHPGFHWVTAIRSSTIRKLERSGFIDPSAVPGSSGTALA